MSKDVYLVYSSGFQVRAAFSTLEDAKRYQAKTNAYSIGIVVVDEHLPFLDSPLSLFRVTVTPKGNIAGMYKVSPPGYGTSLTMDKTLHWEGYAENADDAISAALEYAKDLNLSQ